MLRLVIPCVNARFVNHFSSSSVSCFLYEMPRSKFSPRLINPRHHHLSCLFCISRKNIFAGDPQKREPFLWRARLENAVRRRRERGTESETNQQKAKHAKQLFHLKMCFQWRPLTLLPSFDSTTFRTRIFLHTFERARQQSSQTQAKIINKATRIYITESKQIGNRRRSGDESTKCARIFSSH